MSLTQSLLNHWYPSAEANKPWWRILLWPISILFVCASWFRRTCYQIGLIPRARFRAPVIVVGNITVGGTGKTPMVLYLVQLLKQAGFRPGIVTRGYGGEITEPTLINLSDPVSAVGDEAYMLIKFVDCPVVVGKKRAKAVKYLLTNTAVNVVISDDGMQHYSMRRDLEIAMIDGQRRFGNAYCLPFGPLREPIKRLEFVDFKICKTNQMSEVQDDEYAMQLEPTYLVNMVNGEHIACDALPSRVVHAVAGLGNPDRFFTTLNDLGYEIQPHVFADHHAYSRKDFKAIEQKTIPVHKATTNIYPGVKTQDPAARDQVIPVIMTAKDSVKCSAFAQPHWWYLAVAAKLPQEFNDRMIERVTQLVDKH